MDIFGLSIKVDEPKRDKAHTKKFYRAKKHSWNNSFGLGLFIVKHILELNDFKLIINSNLGVGSKNRL